MNGLIGISMIRADILFADTNTVAGQSFLSHDFGEIVKAVLERNPRADIREVDVMPVMNGIKPGFVNT